MAAVVTSTPRKVVPVARRENISPAIKPAIAAPEIARKDATPTRAGRIIPVPVSNDPIGGTTYGSSYQQLLRTFWNPIEGNLTGRTVETFQMTKEEVSVITGELGKLQQEYLKHITANGELTQETDTMASFWISPFGNEAENANLKFLENLQSQVSENSFNIMMDAMPDIVRGMGWNGEPQEIVIMKVMHKGRMTFRVSMKCVIKEGKIMDALNLEPVSKQDLIRLYGGLIENTGSRILE